MNKLLKRLLIFLISSIILLGLYVVAWAFLIYPNFIDTQDESAKTELSFAEIAEQSDKIDFNEDDGMLYVNNEVVVFIRDNVADDKVSALFTSYDAVVDEAMADIGIYRLVFKKAMEYDDLESLIKKIEAESIVEKAYINTVTEFE